MDGAIEMDGWTEMDGASIEMDGGSIEIDGWTEMDGASIEIDGAWEIEGTFITDKTATGSMETTDDCCTDWATLLWI